MAPGTITIDGRPWTASELASEPPLLKDVYEAARDHVLGLRRVVTEVRLGGVPLQWGDGSLVWDQPYGDGSLELKTDTPLQLSRGLIERVRSTIPTIRDEYRSAAETLRGGDTEAGLRKALPVLEWWQELEGAVDALQRLNDIDLTSSAWSHLGHRVLGSFAAVRDQIEACQEALRQQDYYLFADILEYEIAPLVESWDDVATRLVEGLAAHYGEEPS